jgi:hypothetical protein
MIDDFPVTELDRIWQPPSGGRRIARPRIGVINLGAGSGVRGEAAARVAEARAQLKRIVEKAPQVMVKVSGRQRGADHVAAHMEYIGRHGELEVETDAGEVLKDVRELRERAQEWEDDDDTQRKNAVTSISMVLSMPADTDPDKVLSAVRAFARLELQDRHKYVLALHRDTDHPHVHVTVAAAGADGVRFNPRKADLHRMRETFAHELRERGVDADATCRRARGVTRRTDNVALKKAKERLGKRGETPRTVEAARAAGEAYARQQAVLAPWEKGAILKQRDIKAAYAAVSVKLAASAASDDRALAKQVTAFVAAMPGPLSHRLAQAQAFMTSRERNDITSPELTAHVADRTTPIDRNGDEPKPGRTSSRPDRAR